MRQGITRALEKPETCSQCGEPAERQPIGYLTCDYCHEPLCGSLDCMDSDYEVVGDPPAWSGRTICQRCLDFSCARCRRKINSTEPWPYTEPGVPERTSPVRVGPDQRCCEDCNADEEAREYAQTGGI